MKKRIAEQLKTARSLDGNEPREAIQPIQPEQFSTITDLFDLSEVNTGLIKLETPILPKKTGNQSLKQSINSLHEVYKRHYESENDLHQEQTEDVISAQKNEDDGVCVDNFNGKTEFEILQGYSVQGGYLMFFTIDVHQKQVYLEAFKVCKHQDHWCEASEEHDQLDNKPTTEVQLRRMKKVKLFTADQMDSWSFAVDSKKQMICCFFYSWNFNKTADPLIHASCFNMAKYVNQVKGRSDAIVDPSDFSCQIVTQQLIEKCKSTRIFDVESVIQKTTNAKTNEVGITLVVTCTHDQKTFKKIYAEAIISDSSNLLLAELLQNSPAKSKEKPTSWIKFNKLSLEFQVFDTKENEQDVVGIYTLNDKPIIIYDDGRLHHVEKKDYKSMLQETPLQTDDALMINIKVAHLTSGTKPRLYLQSSDNTVFIFKKRPTDWQQVTKFSKPHYRLVKAYGNFVLVEHIVSYELKLLEIALDSAEPVVTELMLSASNRPMRVDSSDCDMTSLLLYSYAGQDFEFKSQPAGKLVTHSEFNFIDQVCGDYLISIGKYLKRAFIEENFHENFDNPYKASKSVEMPELQAELELETFAAYEDLQNSENQKILLIVKPAVANRIYQIEPQIILLLQPNTYAIRKVCFEELPIKVLVRDDKGRIFVQTDHKLGEYELTDDKDDWSLKPKPHGIQLDLKTSSLTLFDIAHIGDKYYMLLYKRKFFRNSQKKHIYTIEIPDSQHDLDEDADIEKVAKDTITLSKEVTKGEHSRNIFSDDSKLHTRACYDRYSKTVFAIVAGTRFAVLYKIAFEDETKKTAELYDFLTIKNAEQLAVINDKQVAVYSHLEMIVVNHTQKQEDIFADLKLAKPQGKREPHAGEERIVSSCKFTVKTLDFKFSMTSKIKQLAFSHSVLTLIQEGRSFMVNIGELKEPPQIEFARSVTRRRKEQNLPCEEQDDEERLKNFKQITTHTFNEVATYFKSNLTAFQRDGYICLKEENGNWDEEDGETKFTPFEIHSADFLTLSDKHDEESFDEIVITQHSFLNGQSIWEVLIRDAISKQQIDVTKHQLPRFFRPYLEDNCRSLIHHFSHSKQGKLTEILGMPEVKKYYSEFTLPSPIFFDLQGHTPLDLALKNRCFSSFYLLVDFMLEYQNNVRNSFLVRPLMLNILKLGLDIVPLLNSSLCSYRFQSDEIEYFEAFPVFHEDYRTFRENYPDQIESLLHDKDAYNDLFGEKFFPFPEEQNHQHEHHTHEQHDSNLFQTETSSDLLQEPKNSRNAHTRESSKERPVTYHANIYPIAKSSNKSNVNKVSDILEVLAQSERFSIFRTQYIKDFIDYQWDGPLKTAYFVFFIIYLTSFVLSLLSSALMNFDENADAESYDRARIIICAVNALLAIFAIGAFEVRQMIVKKLEYFKSIWNFNDILVLISSVLVLVLEVMHYKQQSQDEPEVDSDLSSEARILKPRKRGGGGADTITTDAGEITFLYEGYVVQWLRVVYAVLIFTGFFKILNVASVFSSVGYLVAMLSGVFYKAMPFMLFFIYLNITFTFIFYVMNINFDETMAKDPMGEYQGIADFNLLPYILFTFRQSLGDFKTDTFLFLPPVERYATWFLWLTCILINAMVFLNFLIATIEAVYQDCNETRIERAYQSKAELLRALDLVLGDFIDCKPVNILVVRQSVDGLDREETNSITELAEQVNRMKIDVDAILQDTKEMKQAITQDSKEIKHEIKELKALIASQAKSNELL